jgi:hypothetical protein
MKCLCGYEGDDFIKKFVNKESFMICRNCGNVISILLSKKKEISSSHEENEKVLVSSLR